MNLSPCPCGKTPQRLIVEFIEEFELILIHGNECACSWAIVKHWRDCSKQEARNQAEDWWSSEARNA